jgi:hypothetical protein
MYYNGEIIASLGGHTENSPNLVNRTLEIYLTKTKVKFYLFNSSSKNWHKEQNIIHYVESKFDDNISDTLRISIKTIMRQFSVKFNDSFKYNGELFKYKDGLEIYHKDNGYIGFDTDGNAHYFGEEGTDGIYYKDLNAWNEENGVIYIGEHQLYDLKNGIITNNELWTKESWCEYVSEHFKYFLIGNKDIESVAYKCLVCGNWRDLTTILNEIDFE